MCMLITMKSKETIGIKSCRFTRECVSFVHACIGYNYPAAFVFA